MHKEIKQALCGTENTAVIIARETAKNGSQTVEHHRYLATELADVFSQDDLRKLAAGEIVTKATTGWAVKVEYASATALFAKAVR